MILHQNTDDPEAHPESPKLKKVAAILLAAGRSERMGAFKPLLPFGPSTVIESCIQYLRQGGVKDIFVVVGHRAEDVRRQLRHAGVSFAVNPDPNSEMNASITCGVAQIPNDAGAVIVALTDQPAIPASVVVELIAEWRKGGRLVKPVFNGQGGHPVLIDLQFRNELMNLDSRRGLKAFFEAHGEEVNRLAVNSPLIARDMDTWDDYRALHFDMFGYQAPEPIR